ncbi:MAG: hypothetical protein R3F31_01985 [Verrucomicrobiales bacterium]
MYFTLAHDITAIGRVNIETGKTEYLRASGAARRRTGTEADLGKE